MPGQMLCAPDDGASVMDIDSEVFPIPTPLAVLKPKRQASPDPEDTIVGYGEKQPVFASVCGLGRQEANTTRAAAWWRLSNSLKANFPPCDMGLEQNVGGNLRAGSADGMGNVFDMWGVSAGRLPVFGTDLVTLVKSTGVSWGPARIPAVCKHILDYLIAHSAFEKEGLFRLTGADFRSRAILRDINAGLYDHGFACLNGQTIERGGCISPPGRANMEPPVLEMAGLLKQFLRDLPVPLIPPYLERIGQLIVDRHRPEKLDDTLKLLRDMIVLLPDASKDMLAFLLDVGACAMRSSHLNLMVSENLARVIAPNLIRVDHLALAAAMSGARGRSAVSMAGLDAFDWIIKWFRLCLDNLYRRADGTDQVEDSGSDGSLLFSLDTVDCRQQETDTDGNRGAWFDTASQTVPRKARFQPRWKKAWNR